MGVWVFIRHGESDANAGGWLAGHLDPDLTPRGVEQARALRDLLRPYDPRLVYTSDLLRARRTAEHALVGRDLPVIPTPALRERTIGQWDGEAREALQQRGVWPTLLSWEGRPPGGESQRDLARRALRWLVDHDGPGVHLAFSHAGLIRVVVGLLDGVPVDRIGLTKVGNGELVEREVPPGGFAAVVPRDPEEQP